MKIIINKLDFIKIRNVCSVKGTDKTSHRLGKKKKIFAKECLIAWPVWLNG